MAGNDTVNGADLIMLRHFPTNALRGIDDRPDIQVETRFNPIQNLSHVHVNFSKKNLIHSLVTRSSHSRHRRFIRIESDMLECHLFQ